MKLKKTLIIVYSYHHYNTLKIANEFSVVLNAEIVSPDNVVLEDLDRYDLVGFGAGIDSGKHYQPILELADRLFQVSGKNAFIFSTSAVQGEKKVSKDHSALRRKLQSKGYDIVGEFSCKGFNTNVFLKYFGGMNKGRPNSQDLAHAKEFAQGILKNNERE